MIDLTSFENLGLRSGFVITEIQFASQPLKDALGREAIAQTRIVGAKFHLLIKAGLSEKELSVTLYHEILEAASVSSLDPPDSIMEFNEGDFERAAYEMHGKLGLASPINLNRMLKDYGFGER